MLAELWRASLLTVMVLRQDEWMLRQDERMLPRHAMAKASLRDGRMMFQDVTDPLLMDLPCVLLLPQTASRGENSD